MLSAQRMTSIPAAGISALFWKESTQSFYLKKAQESMIGIFGIHIFREGSSGYSNNNPVSKQVYHKKRWELLGVGKQYSFEEFRAYITISFTHA